MPTAKKSTKKPLPKRKVFNGKGYQKSSCSSTKGGAKKTAEAARKKGYKARVLKDPVTGKHCVFVRKSK